MRRRLRVLQTHRAEKIALDRARSGAPISPQCNRTPKPPNRAHRRRGTLAKSQCKPNFRRLVPTMMASTCADRRRYACAARANHGKFGLDNLALAGLWARSRHRRRPLPSRPTVIPMGFDRPAWRRFGPPPVPRTVPASGVSGGCPPTENGSMERINRLTSCVCDTVRQLIILFAGGR